MKILYFDCYAGISGDMTIGALLDLGVPLAHLRGELSRLPLHLPGDALSFEETSRHGIRATRFSVREIESHGHRSHAHIDEMICRSSLPDRVKDLSRKMFLRLAQAEARVHGVEAADVHFHEVGALDSIVDIVGTAICIDYLGAAEFHAAPLPLGGGFVDTAHGRLPVPAPATAELLKGLPVHSDITDGERVTPTGAAIISSLASGKGTKPSFTCRAVGCGAGARDFPDVPNILRIFMGEKTGSLTGDEVRVVEAHVDDMNPEILGYLMDRLLAAGALDVAFSPLLMKKNRPGVRITVITPAAGVETMARTVLTETSAIGVRHYPVDRLKLERAVEERETSLGRVKVKVIRDGGVILRTVPEFEECRRIAEARGIPLQEVYRIIERETGSA